VFGIAFTSVNNIPFNNSLFFLGAGGHMIQAKPLLESMLLSCASPPYKLRLHGSHWDSSSEERILTAWRGFLPRDEIASAYNSAEVVIASTILEQARFGMINNRIFEALACGSLVISDDFEALNEMFGDLIFFAHDSDEFKSHLRNILSSQTNYSNYRQRSREVIMSYHTWNHRVVPLLDFYSHLQQSKSQLPLRANSPLVALIVNEEIQTHGDYFYSIRPALTKYIHSGYVVHQFDISDWDLLHQINPLESLRFNVIIAVMSPYDFIHQSFFRYFHPESQRVVPDRKALQKLLCYVIGSPPNIETVTKLSPSWYRSLTDLFDVVLYRDSYEKTLLTEVEDKTLTYRCVSARKCLSPRRDEKRWQHAFGVAVTASSLQHSLPLVVCLNTSMSYCTRKIRDSIVSQGNYLLLLIGGKFGDWLKSCSSDSENDCVLRCVNDPPRLIEMLSHTLHFSSHHNEVLRRICSAHKVYFLFDVRGGGDSLNDQLWPLITAAVCNRPIHFLHHPGAHLSTILSGTCDLWNEEYLQTSWRHASQRLHGLASSRSKVSILSNYASGKPIHIDRLSQSSLIFQPLTDHFLAGRDGKVCLYLDGSSQICLIRNLLEVAVQFPPLDSLPCKLTLNFSFVLRSHVFADEIDHSDPFIVHLCPSQSPEFECLDIVPTTPKPLLKMEQVIFKIDLGNRTSLCSCSGEGE
jgi:hypothetical protein